MTGKIFSKITLWLFMLFLIMLLTACGVQDSPPPPPPPVEAETPERLPMLMDLEATTATVYYATLDKNYLLPLNININATKEVARVAMEKLLAGPPTGGAAPLLPADTKLLDLYSSKSTVYVNVTRDIYGLDWGQAQLAVDAILNTILPLAQGYTLQLLVEGQVGNTLGNVDISGPLELSYVNIDAASRELLLEAEQQQQNIEPVPLTYYLGDSQALFWVPQTLLYLPPDQPSRLGLESHDEDEALPAAYARAVVEAMLAPAPAKEELTRPFWPGTELLDLWVEDNIAYVDFSSQLTGYGGGTATESMMLNCLTRSLTTISGISAVQILIEGQIGNLPEGMDISRPLTPSTPVNML